MNLAYLRGPTECVSGPCIIDALFAEPKVCQSYMPLKRTKIFHYIKYLCKTSGLNKPMLIYSLHFLIYTNYKLFLIYTIEET